MDIIEKNKLFKELFSSFQTGIRSKKSVAPRLFLDSLGLDYQQLNIGFNSGQFHHRKSDEFKNQYAEIGVLTRSNAAVNKAGLTAYACFGFNSVVYPLKDRDNNIVNLFAIRFKLDTPAELYLNENGLYPAFPHQQTKRIYLASTVVDAATLLQAGIPDQKEAVLALRGGTLQSQLTKVLTELKSLSEIVLFNSGSNNITSELQAIIPAVRVIVVNLPDGESINDLYLSYEADGLNCWITEQIQSEQQTKSRAEGCKLVVHSQNKMSYQGQVALYEILGYIPVDFGNLKISLRITTPKNLQVHRFKLDLYDNNEIEKCLTQLADKDNSVNTNLVEADLLQLTDLLEQHRERIFDEETTNNTNTEARELTPSAEKQAVDFLKRPNLLDRIDNLLEQSGIVGEKNVRLTLFIIASTYKMGYPLHSLVQGESGGGKSHLINSISDCMPTEDILNLTRITSKSLYYYNGDELINKLILIQDFDGLDEQAQFAFREIQTAGVLCSSTTMKDRFGNLKSATKTVRAHFASLIATTKAAVYFDNMSRSIVLGIDESPEQTSSIIKYQNQKLSGMINQTKEEQAKQLLRNCLRVLKSHEVINPFADKIVIPVEAQMRRRLNQQFQNFVAQITILNQYQRQRDGQGRLITTVEDLQAAVEAFFPALWLKVDELDSSSRQCFERLKKWVREQPNGTNTRFTERDARSAMNISKTRLHACFQILKELEYIQIVDGSANRGFRYQIVHWDDVDKLKSRIQAELRKQIAEIAVAKSEKRTPEDK